MLPSVQLTVVHMRCETLSWISFLQLPPFKSGSAEGRRDTIPLRLPFFSNWHSPFFPKGNIFSMAVRKAKRVLFCVGGGGETASGEKVKQPLPQQIFHLRTVPQSSFWLIFFNKVWYICILHPLQPCCSSHVNLDKYTCQVHTLYFYMCT